MELTKKTKKERQTISENLKDGKARLSCATLLTDEVPTTDLLGKSSKDLYGNPFFTTRASLGSALAETADNSHPSGRAVGTSLSECTMRSTERLSRPSSSSFVHRPLSEPPSRYSGLNCQSFSG